ncbi:peptidyl-prolyl cis-trans isomerase [Burkholderia arboris]|uniref:Peptidyl-prolyl cis-trans isomerase n=2 Tax=Burkholderia arboris TaxID=488730 RepID=A0A9Q9SNI6_9BURK|nr:peptidyl-prolyl cis-trans isomerase [Burkholderia arboris]
MVNGTSITQGEVDAMLRASHQYSQAPTASVGGELSWVSFKTPVQEGKTHGFPVAVAQAITRLPVGGVTSESIPLSNDANGPRAIVKVDARRPTQMQTFEAAKPTIRQELEALETEKATASFVDGLMKGASIDTGPM